MGVNALLMVDGPGGDLIGPRGEEANAVPDFRAHIAHRVPAGGIKRDGLSGERRDVVFRPADKPRW